MNSPWPPLELLPGLVTFPCIWRLWLQDCFEAFKLLCLQESARKPISFPCPMRTSCAYAILTQPDGLLTGECQRSPLGCPRIQLTTADITPLELNWDKLGRALCKALQLNPITTELNLFHTRQIGSWSADAVPVILTIQTEVHDLLFTVGLLTSRLRQKFILLAPTSELVDFSCKELLANWGAALFPLDSIVTLTPHGTLLPVKPPGEIFANFQPAPNDPADEALARETIAFVDKLDGHYHFRKAPFSRILILYCARGLSARAIARECHCSVRLVFSRLRWLTGKLGRDPAELRQYSSHFEAIEQSLSHPKAKKIHRKSAIYGDDSEQSFHE